MKYLKNFKRHNLNENHNYNYIDDIEFDWDTAKKYVRDNYDFEEYFKTLGEDIFDFMSDYDVNDYYEHLFDSWVKNTTLKDIAEWDEDRVRNVIKDNESLFSDEINQDDLVFDDAVDQLTIEEVIQLIEDEDLDEDLVDEFLYEAYFEPIQEIFKNSDDEEYYIKLEEYFDKGKAIGYFLETEEDEISDFYLEDIEVDDDLKDDLIDYNLENIYLIFNILSANNDYGKSKDFQEKYIKSELQDRWRYDLDGDYSQVKDEHLQVLITEIENKFGITKELKSKYKKLLKRISRTKFNI